MPGKIIIAGEGGQGVQTVAKIIASAAQKSGKKLTYLPNFGVEQRGGVSLSFIQISTDDVAYPRFAKADIVVVFCNRAVSVVKDFLAENTLFIYDSSEINNKYLEELNVKNYLAIPAKKVGTEKYSSKVANMILLGAILAHFKGIGYEEVEKSLLEELGEKIKKSPEIKDLNLNALREGMTLAENFDMQKTPFTGKDEKEIEKEFNSDKIKWRRFPEYCKGCGLCIVRCPQKALSFSKDLGFLGNPLPIVDMEKCTGCGTCQSTCPDAAIEVKKNE